MMKKQFVLPVLLSIVFMVCSCSKEDDSPNPDPDPVQEDPQPDPEPDPEPEILIGVFKDAEVEGLTFETTTQSGTTNTAGEFSYIEGEEVTFKVGQVVLGSAQGQELITPITLAQTVDASATIESNLAQNIAALLQTLDVDGDESNGISITTEVASNLGVDMIDFAQPVESILADIILNVIQNTGVELEIVYPSEAAESMGESLGIPYDAPENLVLTYLIPTLKTFFENWDNNYTSTSSLYKTTYDANGNLTMIDVLSRYSGKQFFKMDMMTLNASGLPENCALTNYAKNRLTGSFGLPEFTNQVELQYNAQNQVSSLAFVGDDGNFFNKNQFTSHDENNRPLAYFRDLAPDNPNREFTISWDFTYENNLIATAKRVYDDEDIGDFPYHFISTREFTYNYNEYDNISSITYSRVFDDTYILDGQQVQQVTESSIEDIFTYDSNQKLVSYTENQLILDDGRTFETERTYDENEQITLVKTVRSDGFESTTNFNGGVATTTETFANGLLTFEEERFSDGSRTSTSYYYDANGNLSQTDVFEFDASFLITDRVLTFYNEDGSIWYSFDQDFDANGFLTQETGTYADGEIFGIWYYDQNGLLSRQDVYFEGSLNYYIEFEYNADFRIVTATDFWPDGELFGIRNYTYNDLGFTETITYSGPDGLVYLTDVFEYDENGFVLKISGFGANGNLSYVLNYEDGVLVSEEIYDENGNLIEVIDYTGTTKSPRFFKQDISKSSNKVEDSFGQDYDKIQNSSIDMRRIRKMKKSKTTWNQMFFKLPSEVSSKVLKIRTNQ